MTEARRHTKFQKKNLNFQRSKRSDTGGPDKCDFVVSEACTRSGAFALLISVVLTVLVTSWAREPRERALGKYIEDRENLASLIERLDDDPVWQRFKESNADAESLWLRDLPTELNVTVTKRSTSSESSPDLSSSSKPQNHASVPSPPLTLSITHVVQLPEVRQIIDAMKSLNDAGTILLVSKYSNYFDISIVRWNQKRIDLIYQNALNYSCATDQIETPHANPVPPDYVPQVNASVMFECLRLSDLRILAHYEQPELSNPDQIGGRIGGITNYNALGAIPADRYLASLVSNALLLFALIYFGTFTREAVMSPRFPLQGTLFAAFSRSPGTAFTMLLAIWLPGLASIAVAFESNVIWLWAESLLIICVIVWITAVLQRRSYWASFMTRRVL